MYRLNLSFTQIPQTGRVKAFERSGKILSKIAQSLPGRVLHPFSDTILNRSPDLSGAVA